MPDEISTLPADVARLQSDATAGVAATQRAMNSALRLIAALAERVVVLEDAARRTPAGRSNFEAASAERAKMLVPVTQQPPAAKPQPMPEPKTPEEIPAYVGKLREYSATLKGMADKARDPADKARYQGLVGKLETKADLWEAKLKPSPAAEPDAPVPAAEPGPSPAVVKAARRMI